jgi:carbamoyl-phosphate synthase large subunit
MILAQDNPPPNPHPSPPLPKQPSFKKLLTSSLRVMDIYELETATGVVVSVGGQLPQNIALRLQETGGAKILGTNPKDIDRAEDRQKFSGILDSIGVDQPAWKELTSVAAAEEFANEVGFPVRSLFC